MDYKRETPRKDAQRPSIGEGDPSPPTPTLRNSSTCAREALGTQPGFSWFQWNGFLTGAWSGFNWFQWNGFLTGAWSGFNWFQWNGFCPARRRPGPTGGSGRSPASGSTWGLRRR